MPQFMEFWSTDSWTEQGQKQTGQQQNKSLHIQPENIAETSVDLKKKKNTEEK